ncbi:hypothetical protein [Megasphaera vaginalis (ex Srinivasan et al. 2021)]|uniref:hypothetical protein n=1 Tax=Megasphaera vaginalis (ex Srinivasan et al. 2021) TaxID=1111454 RepID=UPI00040D5291|nr:hypothetical protein [Megasphaera vaginalis (ex Srinivasan et al. 2021)]
MYFRSARPKSVSPILTRSGTVPTAECGFHSLYGDAQIKSAENLALFICVSQNRHHICKALFV